MYDKDVGEKEFGKPLGITGDFGSERIFSVLPSDSAADISFCQFFAKLPKVSVPTC